MLVSGVQSLGALPVIIASIVKAVAQNRWNDAQAARALGEQFEIMQTLREAQITELALALSEATGTPNWQWFTTLRNAQEVGYFDRGSDNGTPPPAAKDNTMLWVALGAGALILAVGLR